MKNWKEEMNKLILKIEITVLSYVECKVDKAYIYLYSKDGVDSFSFFYLLNKKIYGFNEIISALEYSFEKKQAELRRVFDTIMKSSDEIQYLWKENHDVEYPAETKIIYDLCNRTEEILYNPLPTPIGEEQDFYSYLNTWENELKLQHGQEIDEFDLQWVNQQKYATRERNEMEEFQVERVLQSDWKQLFSSCLGKMTAIQLACDQYVVKNQNWNVNFQEGLISFGEDAYPIQFLGSESNQTNTWLWGWENVNQFDTQLLQLVEQVRQYGEEKALAPLQKAELMLDDDINGHTLSIVACGIQEPPVCYYRCPHANGAAFVALTDIPEDVFQPVDAWKFMNIVAQCLKTHIVDQKIFVESFLNWNQTAYTWNGMVLTAQFHQPMEIEFEIVEGMWRVKQLLLV